MVTYLITPQATAIREVLAKQLVDLGVEVVDYELSQTRASPESVAALLEQTTRMTNSFASTLNTQLGQSYYLPSVWLSSISDMIQAAAVGAFA